MKKLTIENDRRIIFFILSVFSFFCLSSEVPKKKLIVNPELKYTVSIPDPNSHLLHVTLFCQGLNMDTILFRMPQWMPGYYQIMNYANDVRNLVAKGKNGENLAIKKPDGHSWKIAVKRNTPFSVSYDVKAEKQFVANSYVDSTHAYIIPEATFLYIDGRINTPVSVTVNPLRAWNSIATGLDSVAEKKNSFTAPDFDVLYDCPLLTGKLEALNPFEIDGIKHRFIGYNLGNFDRNGFIAKLAKAVRAGIEIIGEIPYSQYTFIAIGKGFGGIEHLDNSTISFNGTGIDEKDAMERTLSFLAHEYFHCYNVKCIRPYELGPFDYSSENRTNMLWVSEGLTVYYEYLILKRAGLINEQDLLDDFGKEMTTLENNQGRFFQSLAQAAYETWSDGPFGDRGRNAGKTISYYNKGPVVGLILDLTIRKATGNKKSLDDVMRLLYTEYYRNKHRGFTDAEFRQACESVAGESLAREFEYVYTTKEIDYSYYLSFAGLRISEETNPADGKKKISIEKMQTADRGQLEILSGWMNGNYKSK